MRTILMSLIILTLSAFSFGQNNADKLLGTYLAPDGTSKMEFLKSGNKYFSKITWLKEPNDPKTHKPNTDTENPDASKRNQPILGLCIAKDLKYDGKNAWEDGTIYDPNTGKTWDCDVILNGNQLKIKGYWKISWIGKTEVWTKTSSQLSVVSSQ